MQESKKLHLISLGCVKNLVDSEVMLGRLRDYEISDDIHSADVIIINTCGFIEAAKRESLQVIFDAIRDRKEGSILVVSGCLSERYQEAIKAEIPEIDIITGVSDYDRIDEMVNAKKGIMSEKVFLSDENNERLISASAIHAYVKISEGCNQQCSFCAIPSFKGKLQSRSIESVSKEINRLSERGFLDISLVAQDSSSFLKDHQQQDGLIHLIKQLDHCDIKSARVLYLYPSTTTPALIEAIADSCVVQNYFDMPIQHIADPMLKRMRRGVNRKRHEELLSMMRSMDRSFLRTSIIVGHPGETQEEFEALLEFLEGFAFDRVNVFAYSDEEGTRAYEYPDKIDPDTIQARIEAVNQIISKQHTISLERLLGMNIPVILEGKHADYEYLYKARDIRWAPEIDGEVLINDVAIQGEVSHGYYMAEITQIVGHDVIATLKQAH